MSHNRLTDLFIVSRLPKLRTLKADGNALAALPPELVALAGSLTELSLVGNLFDDEPPVVAALREANPELRVELDGGGGAGAKGARGVT